MIRAVLCAVALLCAAPALHAQCTWEPGRPRGRREAQDDSIYKAVQQAQRGAIGSALQAAGVSDPRGLVVVTTERDGAAPVIRVFDANFPLEALDRAARVLVERLKEVPARQGGRVSSLLRLDTTALPAARADGRRHDCKPRLINRELVANELQRWASSTSEAERVPRAALIGIALSREGHVVYAEVSRSSGSDAVDRFAHELVQRLVFRPATLDGVTRDVWAVLPITFR